MPPPPPRSTPAKAGVHSVSVASPRAEPRVPPAPFAFLRRSRITTGGTRRCRVASPRAEWHRDGGREPRGPTTPTERVLERSRARGPVPLSRGRGGPRRSSARRFHPDGGVSVLGVWGRCPHIRGPAPAGCGGAAPAEPGEAGRAASAPPARITAGGRQPTRPPHQGGPRRLGGSARPTPAHGGASPPAGLSGGTGASAAEGPPRVIRGGGARRAGAGRGACSTAVSGASRAVGPKPRGWSVDEAGRSILGRELVMCRCLMLRRRRDLRAW